MSNKWWSKALDKLEKATISGPEQDVQAVEKALKEAKDKQDKENEK